MIKRMITGCVCLCLAFWTPLSPAAAQSTQAQEIETLLGGDVSIVSIQPSGGDAAYAQTILQRDGMASVAVFRKTDGAWALEAQTPCFSAEEYRSLNLDDPAENSFHFYLYPADGGDGYGYRFQRLDGVWQTAVYEGKNFTWYLEDEGSGIRYYDDSVCDRLSGFWRFPMAELDLVHMPQTADDLRARLLTDDVARMALAEYETVPLRDSPSADAAYACVLVDGAMVHVLATRDEWVCVSPGGDISGWVPTNTLEIDNQGYRSHFIVDMAPNTRPATIYAAPSPTAEVRRTLSGSPALYIIGWCGGEFSDVGDGVWGLVYDRDGIGYIRLHFLSYGNG